jgi:hypothetical protein
MIWFLDNDKFQAFVNTLMNVLVLETASVTIHFKDISKPWSYDRSFVFLKKWRSKFVNIVTSVSLGISIQVNCGSAFDIIMDILGTDVSRLAT